MEADAGSILSSAAMFVCLLLQGGLTVLGLLFLLTFWFVGRGVEEKAKKPWRVASLVTAVLVVLGWIALLVLWLLA
ncbi:MAG TPA: hypothetical protein RMG45_12290 [Polyangiaceae bacterium LLY-WYZ-15_(1-7)]|nr:hypothetical protein [Polyangiaceae bacterium LLY-WYZ-15_(1-7)]